jgi:hypothetical protein
MSCVPWSYLLLPHTLATTAYETKDIFEIHTPLPATIKKNIWQNIEKRTIYHFKIILTRIQLGFFKINF